jgi:autotransporter translocation and assembly factor TamB
VRFNGDPKDGQVDLIGKHEVRLGRDRDPDVTITAAVRNGFDSPRLTLSSDPAMEEGDIVATLLTGRPPSGTVATSVDNDPMTTTSAASAIVAGQASSAVEELGTDIGLDVLQVEIDGVGGRQSSPGAM